jgi:hypothetical protein
MNPRKTIGYRCVTGFVKENVNNFVPPILEVFIRQMHTKSRFNLPNDVGKVVEQFQHWILVFVSSLFTLRKQAAHSTRWLANGPRFSRTRSERSERSVSAATAC